MTSRQRRIASSCLALFGLLIMPAAFAGVTMGGTVTFGPEVTSIPTLSEWGLIALGLLMTVVVYRILRGHLGGRPLASVVLAGALGLGVATSGGRWMTAVYALDGPPLASAGGGTVSIPSGADYTLINTSGVPQTIRAVAAQPGYNVNHGVAAPECIVGIVVPPSGSCHVRFDFGGAA